MELPRDRPLMLSLREEGGRSLAVTLQRLATAPGIGARIRLLARRLAPRAITCVGAIQSWRGEVRRGLMLAYLWRPVSTVLRLPTALIAWRRARRASGDRSR